MDNIYWNCRGESWVCILTVKKDHKRPLLATVEASMMLCAWRVGVRDNVDPKLGNLLLLRGLILGSLV